MGPVALKSHWNKATKWITAGVSTVAALVSILSYAHSCGLLGETNEMRMTVADLAVERVELVPRFDTVQAIGDTVHLAARMTDRHGVALLGATTLWSSANPDVASVDGAGTVVARAPGTAVILASAGEHTARAAVIVAPRVAQVHVAPDSTLKLREGEQTKLAARAADMHGYAIAHQRATWRTGDTTIATIDSTGKVTAIAQGRTTLFATIDGVSSQISLDVMPALGAMTIVSGANQEAKAGARLPAPITVQIVSRRGHPVPGVMLHFAPGAGYGSVDPAAATTDAHGWARSSWTLGARPGTQQLLITSDGLDTVVTISAESDPIPSNTRIRPLADTLSALAGQALAEPVAVQVTDTAGVPLGDVPISWSTPDGGTIMTLTARTDSLGRARAQWTLGAHTGTQRAYVHVGAGRTIAPFAIRAIARAGAPASIEVVSGTTQSGVVGAMLTRPVTLRVLDRAGNGVPGVPVHWSPESGSVPDSVLTTDSTGRVRAYWTLGRSAGTQRMIARVEHVAHRIDITARAHPRGAANVAFLSPPTSGVAGQPLTRTVRAQVTDVYGNPVDNALVLFRVRSGRTSPTRVMTDAHGIATTRWVLGAGAGEQSLTVTVRGADAAGKLTLAVRAATLVRRVSSR